MLIGAARRLAGRRELWQQARALSFSTMSVDDIADERTDSENVALTWTEHNNHRQIDIRLLPLSEVVIEEPEFSASSIKERLAPSEGAVPESVLQFERQRRKAQHAQKAGALADVNHHLRVLYHDEHIVVVSKPPGVLTVPGIHSRDSLLRLVYDKIWCDWR